MSYDGGPSSCTTERIDMESGTFIGCSSLGSECFKECYGDSDWK